MNSLKLSGEACEKEFVLEPEAYPDKAYPVSLA